MKFEFVLFGRTFKIYFYTHKELNLYVAGITNKCVGGRYVTFIDYDNIPLDWVQEELYFLMEKYFLSHFHIFKTKKGFHAINTEKISLHQLVDVLRDTSTDAAYLNVPLRRAKKVWTLRSTEKSGNKPSYVKTLVCGIVSGQQSKPHNELLRKLYNVKIPNDSEDNEKSFWTGHYHIEG